MVNDGYWIRGVIYVRNLEFLNFNVLFHVMQNIAKCIMKDMLLYAEMWPFAS